jgi:hypothetical protein
MVQSFRTFRDHFLSVYQSCAAEVARRRAAETGELAFLEGAADLEAVDIQPEEVAAADAAGRRCGIYVWRAARWDRGFCGRLQRDPRRTDLSSGPWQRHRSDGAAFEVGISSRWPLSRMFFIGAV